jgi:GAF domain-containing protein
MLNRQYLRQEWERLPKEQKLVGFRHNITGSAMLESPIKIPDVQHVLERGELFQEPGGKGQPARLIIPVQIRGETIGVLNIQSPEVEEWNQDQIEIAMAVAERVALSAENARLFEETSRRAERERTVSQITTSIRSTTDPQVMLQTAMDELKRVLGATEINIRPYTSSSSTRAAKKKDPIEKNTSTK